MRPCDNAEELFLMVEVLYVDNHVLLVNKPAGLATQPIPTSDESLELLCKEWIKEQYQKPGNVFLHAIHRLDKPVSGIVLFARTSKALSRLNESMRSHEMQKVYLALVEGHLKDPEARLEHYLVHGDHYAHLATEKTPDAKRASLKYIVKEERNDCSLLEITLETGRYHQIRAQMAAIGHPVVGDSKYGSVKPYAKQGITLCHARFSFPHPISKEPLLYSVNCQF